MIFLNCLSVFFFLYVCLLFLFVSCFLFFLSICLFSFCIYVFFYLSVCLFSFLTVCFFLLVFVFYLFFSYVLFSFIIFSDVFFSFVFVFSFVFKAKSIDFWSCFLRASHSVRVNILGYFNITPITRVRDLLFDSKTETSTNKCCLFNQGKF